MLDRDQAEELVKRALSFSDADETEVILSHGEENLTRFSNNIITQNVARDTDGLAVKVHLGKKVGRAGTNRFDDESLKRAIANAKLAASQAKENSDLLALRGQGIFQETPAYCQNTADFGPEERADAIARFVAAVKKERAEAAGIFSSGGEAVAMGNSRGLFAFHRETKAVFSGTVEVDGASGWAEEVQLDVSKLDVSAVIDTAIRKALQARNPIALEPGPYDVVLEPAAVTDFLMFMTFEGFGGLNFIEGRSFMSGKIGQKVMGENVTIVDDAYSKLSPGLPFDFEGSPRQRVVLIEKGVARAPVHDRITAAKVGTQTTGHSLPQPNSSGPFPLNVALQGGNSSLAEMIESTPKGILVTHFHYSNVLDPIKLTLTGMTRDGTLLIENGKITKPIRNMRFTESVVEAFNRIKLISKDRITAHAFFGGAFVVPAVKMAKFTFSSVSEF